MQQEPAKQDSDLGTFLVALAALPDDQIDMAEGALRLAAADRPGLSLDPYRHQLAGLGARAAQRHKDFIAAGAQDDLRTQIAALKQVLVDEEGYVGDLAPHDHMENANLIGTMNTRRGLPVTLGILYLHAARGAGFDITGVDFPGHFLLRGQQGSDILLFDPADACRLLDAPDLRALIKAARGPMAELRTDYYRPLSNRGVLIRLLNNIKFRQVALYDYAGALRTLDYMSAIDPDEFRVLLDRGVLCAKLGQKARALAALTAYMDHLPAQHISRPDVRALMNDIAISLPDEADGVDI